MISQFDYFIFKVVVTAFEDSTSTEYLIKSYNQDSGIWDLSQAVLASSGTKAFPFENGICGGKNTNSERNLTLISKNLKPSLPARRITIPFK